MSYLAEHSADGTFKNIVTLTKKKDISAIAILRKKLLKFRLLLLPLTNRLCTIPLGKIVPRLINMLRNIKCPLDTILSKASNIPMGTNTIR